MNPKEKSIDILENFHNNVVSTNKIHMCREAVIQCALIAVNYIITSNPHSNPFNTDVHSTMDYWIEVKQEIEKL